MTKWRYIRTCGRAIILALACILGTMLTACAASPIASNTGKASGAAACHDIATAPSSPDTTTANSTITPTNARPAPQADQLMRDGADAYAKGDFGRAASRFEAAMTQYEKAGREGDRCDALLDMGAAYEALGSYKEAADALTTALPLARRLKDRGRELDLLGALGTVYTFTHNYSVAEAVIDQGLKLAATEHDEVAAAKLLNAGGVLLAAQGKYQAAHDTFQLASSRAAKIDLLTQVRAETNAALVVVRAGKDPTELHDYDLTETPTWKLPDCHEKANLLITQGRILWLANKGGMDDAWRALESRMNYQRAATVAEKIGDHLMLSFALGYQGEIAEVEKRDADALALTRRALFLAQEVQSADALYRWEWQLGRILHNMGRNSDAIDAYGNALETLHGIRGDLANGFGNQADPRSFRESVGPIYYQMADLLLRRADTERDEAIVQNLLLKARETVEALKTGELEDYFQRKCVNVLDQKRIEQIDAGTAVVYLIPLPDRTEMLVSTANGLKRFKSPVGSEELTAEVREFRGRLEDRSSNRYLRNARKLYNWIIRPIEPTLGAEKIDTLVFVPDGALRTIPMAALNDGKEPLIAKYAVAITPGLTLMAPRRLRDLTRPTLLEGGLSQSVGGFPALEFVPQELSGIHHLFPGTELLNGSFTTKNLSREMGEHAFAFVHFASHAEFSHDEKETFLLVYPGSNDADAKKLSLKELGNLLRPTKFRDQPVELLALSACQTAAGDDRAALGLAGIAIEMGARSAVATLWSINDQASADLVEHFYASLSADPTLSKAKAMQRAQLQLMRDVRYSHPCYWAPYLVIGNWL